MPRWRCGFMLENSVRLVGSRGMVMAHARRPSLEPCQGAGLGREVLTAEVTAIRRRAPCGPRLDVDGASDQTAHTVGPEDRRERVISALPVGGNKSQMT